MIDVGSFSNIDGSLGSSVGSSKGNVGMPLVLRSGSIGRMGIPAVSVHVVGPGSKTRGDKMANGYRCDWILEVCS